MTKRIVYNVSLWAFLATAGMTLAALIVPEWMSWDTDNDNAKHIHHSYGLYSRCTSVSATCTPFPRSQDCRGPEAPFCRLWRTASFLMSLAFVFELVTLVAFFITLFGSKTRLVQGWRVVVALLALSALGQVGAMGIMSYLFEYDDRFSIPGWRLDKGWALCTTSWVLQVFVGIGVVFAVVIMGEEGGYELIPEALADRLRDPRNRQE